MAEDKKTSSEPSEPNDKNEHINGWRAFGTLEQFLIDDQWHPQQLEDKTIFRVYYSGDNGDLRCYAQVRVDLEQFVFYVVAPVKAPEEVRPGVAEYITRANYGLRIGNFEMDYGDGEIRCKTSIDFEESTLDNYLIKNAIYAAVHTMDFYLPGLLSVMFGNDNPEQSIAETEGT